MRRGNNYELRRAAYRGYRRALAWGIVRPPARCETCKRGDVKLHAHHEDYAAFWRVEYLCPACHRARHRGALH